MEKHRGHWIEVERRETKRNEAREERREEREREGEREREREREREKERRKGRRKGGGGGSDIRTGADRIGCEEGLVVRILSAADGWRTEETCALRVRCATQRPIDVGGIVW